jgi:hypothetical protein
MQSNAVLPQGEASELHEFRELSLTGNSTNIWVLPAVSEVAYRSFCSAGSKPHVGSSQCSSRSTLLLFQGYMVLRTLWKLLDTKLFSLQFQK